MEFHIHDADRHVIEPLSMWKDYLDPSVYQSVALTLEKDDPVKMMHRVARLGDKAAINISPKLMIKGQPVLKNWTEAMQVAAAYKKLTATEQMHLGTSPELQIQSMDDSGIVKANIFPTFAGFLVNNENLTADESLAFAKAYNLWLKDYCDFNTSRLQGVGLISRHDPESLVSQVEFISELGFKCVVIRAEVILGRTLAHPDYQAFWRECEARGIAIAFHGGTHLNAPTVGHDRFSTHFSLHACAHPMELQMAFLSLLEGGVLEQYPRLKFAFLEGGAAWIPHWLWRLDEICYPDLPTEISTKITMKPSEYFKRQCWVALELGEPCLRQVIDSIGIEKLLFGTDFPHPDHVQFDVNDIKQQCAGLSEQELKMVLEQNPAVFFG